MKNIETVGLQLKDTKEINAMIALEKKIMQERVPVRRLKLQRADSDLSIQADALGKWLGKVNAKKNGIYFLDLDIPQTGPILGYSMNFKDQSSGRLLRLNYEFDRQSDEEIEEKFIRSLIFDLILFNGTESVLVFQKEQTEKFLMDVSTRYFEFADRVDAIIERLVDMSEVFTKGWYQDSRIEENTINGIYHSLNPGSSVNMASQGSYALYLIYSALQSVHHQLHGVKIAA